MTLIWHERAPNAKPIVKSTNRRSEQLQITSVDLILHRQKQLTTGVWRSGDRRLMTACDAEIKEWFYSAPKRSRTGAAKPVDGPASLVCGVS